MKMSGPPQAVHTALSAGELLGGVYEIVRRIATGGTGTVYVAKNTRDNDSLVAIKVLHRTHHADKSIVARFTQEARLLNSIDHLNIVKIKDISVQPGSIFLVSEFIFGKTLDQIVQESEQPFQILPGLIEQICQGLKVVHARGILHRDLKPENILVQADGLVKLIDFGAARSPHSQLTLAGQLIGTTPYIAPEVWIEKRLTPAIDFYSLGVILYQVTTKQLPFQAQRTSELMRLHVQKAAIPPKEHNEAIPDWLNYLILRLLEKSPVTRYQSAEQVLSFLQNSRREQFKLDSRKSFRPLQTAQPPEPSVTSASLTQARLKTRDAFSIWELGSMLQLLASLQCADWAISYAGQFQALGQGARVSFGVALKESLSLQSTLFLTKIIATMAVFGFFLLLRNQPRTSLARKLVVPLMLLCSIAPWLKVFYVLWGA